MNKLKQLMNRKKDRLLGLKEMQPTLIPKVVIEENIITEVVEELSPKKKKKKGILSKVKDTFKK